MVAAASAAVAAAPVPGLSLAFDTALLIKEINFFKSQLSIPKENSEEFRRTTPEIKAKILKFCVTSAVQIGRLLIPYAASSAVEEVARYIPFVGNVIAAKISFATTIYFLNNCLSELEETALNVLDKIGDRVVDDLN